MECNHPEVKGLFLSHCLAFCHQCPKALLSAVYSDMVFLNTVKCGVWTFLYFLNVSRICIFLLEKRSAARDKWVKPERQLFTSDTCISLQMPHQWLTLSPGCTIVCWRTLQNCSEYLHAPLQVGPAQLFPRKRQKRAGLLAFPCLWKIKRAVGDFGLIHSSTLYPSPKSPPQKNQEDHLRWIEERWSQGHRVISEERSGAPLPPLLVVLLLWSLRNGFHRGVWVERKAEELFCLSELYLTWLTRWMLLREFSPCTNEGIMLSFLILSFCFSFRTTGLRWNFRRTVQVKLKYNPSKNATMLGRCRLRYENVY